MSKTRGKRILPWLWFFGCMAALLIFMQWRTDYVLNSDMASELVLANLLAKENAILSQNWYYATELHVWFSQLIYAPLFKVFADWHTVRMVGSFVLYALVLLGYYYLCRRLRIARWFPWTAPVLMLPVSTLYFQYAVYATPYTFYIANAFFILAMTLHWSQSKSRAGRAALACGVGALSLLTGMNGPRYLMDFYAPLILAAAVLLFRDRNALLKDGRVRLKANARFSFLLFSVFSGLCAAAGYLFNIGVLSHRYDFYHYESIHFANLTFAKLEAVINGWLHTLGYSAVGALLSVHAAQNLFYLGLTVLIIMAIRHGMKHPRLYSDGEQTVVWLFTLSALIFIGVYLTTDAAYFERYDLPIAVFALPAVALFLNRVGWRPIWKRTVCALLVCAVTFNAALAYHALWQEDDTGELRAISSLLTEKGYREGYASFWNANVMTELTDGDIDVRCWGSNSTTDLITVERTMPWLQWKAHETTKPEGAVFVLFNNREREAFTIVENLDEGAILYRTDEYVLYGYDSYAALESDASGN
jgi:hypothetical protein